MVLFVVRLFGIVLFVLCRNAQEAPLISPGNNGGNGRKPKNKKPHKNGHGVPVPRDNLGRWPKGVSGNPGGRPKHTRYISEIIAEKLQERYPDDPAYRTYGEVIAEKALELAAEGKLPAISEIMDRLEGRPTQHVKAEVVQKGNPNVDFEALDDNELSAFEEMLARAQARGTPTERK